MLGLCPLTPEGAELNQIFIDFAQIYEWPMRLRGSNPEPGICADVPLRNYSLTHF